MRREYRGDFRRFEEGADVARAHERARLAGRLDELPIRSPTQTICRVLLAESRRGAGLAFFKRQDLAFHGRAFHVLVDEGTPTQCASVAVGEDGSEARWGNELLLFDVLTDPYAGAAPGGGWVAGVASWVACSAASNHGGTCRPRRCALPRRGGPWLTQDGVEHAGEGGVGTWAASPAPTWPPCLA